MIGATICSGIGAPEVAAPQIDWRLASEIEPFPCEVLKVRHGHADVRRGKAERSLWGDFTALRVRHMRRFGIPFPNVIVAGTPCQAFSVAGLRQSLNDDRGNLTLEFVRLVHAIRRATVDFRYLLWENVPGVLSTRDNAFGCFLGAIVGSDAPLHSPLERGRWPSAGMVSGPFARAAWRVLDAQYFGVAQRRQRVFVVASFGDGADPAAILFERLGLSGNYPPSRETGQNAGPTLSARPTGGGALGTDFDLDGGLVECAIKGSIAFDEVAAPLRSGPTAGKSHGKLNGSDRMPLALALNAKGGSGRFDAESETLIAHPLLAKANSSHDDSMETYVAHSLRAAGFDASEDGTGRGTPLVAVDITNASCGGDLSGTLERAQYKHNRGQGVIAFTQNSRSEVRKIGGDGSICGDSAAEPGAQQQTYVAQVASPITKSMAKSIARAGKESGVTNGVIQAVSLRGREGGSTAELSDVPSALRASNGGGDKAHCMTETAVRRLTPRECERLQSYEDDYTLIKFRGKPAADGNRYKALGNSMNRKVISWLLNRLVRADERREIPR